MSGWERYQELVLDKLDTNESDHKDISACIGEMQAAVVKIEMDLSHVAGRRNGRSWWRPVVLSAGLGLVAACGAWSAARIIDHDARLLVVESSVAASARELQGIRAGIDEIRAKQTSSRPGKP